MHRLMAAVLICGSLQGFGQVKSVPMKAYLSFARASADWAWEHYDSLETVWEKRLDPDNVFGYRPPPHFLEMAVIYAELFEKEGNETFARRAVRVLNQYGEYRETYRERVVRLRTDYSDDIPALPDFFTTMRYIRAYDSLKRRGKINRSDRRKIEEVIVGSIRYLLRTQEWGPMNRTILRAETLAWALKAMPDHPDAADWAMVEESLAFDNWGNWEIEDATIYHAVWLYGLIGYADAKGELADLFETPEMYYYSHYFLNLMCPDGMIPDFGDANWRSNWHRYLVYFETAAAVYNNAELKWAASRVAGRFLDLSQVRNTGLAYMLLDIWKWGTDEIKPEQPTGSSMEVMEDVQGKKIVFRNGWDRKSTYCLLNYRDEGDGGLLFRDYLRDTIPVEEEKMTHGHADENSIVLLMAGGSVLLHDGGYRDYMPSGPYGAYRQDYFHNRLCVRPEKFWMGQKQGEWRYSITGRTAVPGQSILDFLHNAGSYREVRTRKIDFLTFDDFDYSRTRVIDDKMGYQWDRILVYLKEPACFVVFDILKGLKEEYFTASNLWHTRKILSSGKHWYDTVYDSIGNADLETGNRLLIVFPETHYRMEHVEKEKRHYQDEWVIAQTGAQFFELGQTIGFVTVLVPHEAKENPEKWTERISMVGSEPENAGMAIKISMPGKEIRIGVKKDLRMDMIRDWRRPKYTYDSGKIRYGALETNGDFLVSCLQGRKLRFTVVNLTKATWGETVLLEKPPGFFGLAFDGSADAPGTGKVRYWRNTVTLK